MPRFMIVEGGLDWLAVVRSIEKRNYLLLVTAHNLWTFLSVHYVWFYSAESSNSIAKNKWNLLLFYKNRSKTTCPNSVQNCNCCKCKKLNCLDHAVGTFDVAGNSSGNVANKNRVVWKQYFPRNWCILLPTFKGNRWRQPVTVDKEVPACLNRGDVPNIVLLWYQLIETEWK